MHTTTAIEQAIQEALENGLAVVDSYALAAATQSEVTYTQHVLREASHVCRYSVGNGLYAIHREPECSTKCQEHATRQAHSETPYEVCGHCSLRFPIGTECGLCG